jgi:hypothetical protein
MKMNGTRKFGVAALAAGLLACCQAGRGNAADIAVVIPSNSGPYAEAYAGFMTAMPKAFDLTDLSKPGAAPPEEARYAAAFGAKAAAAEYPPGTHLVYALTPVSGRGRLWHEISMAPEPAAALAAYKSLQPGLRRLAVFWTAYPGERYMTDLNRAGRQAGVEIISARLKGPDAFPERLRRLLGSMDAFWLMPDPALITQASIMVLASFSCANGIPFYAPTSALLSSGATASYAPEFSEAGAAAARALLAMYNGGRLPPVTYVEKITMRVNRDLNEKCRWPIGK